MAEPNNNIKELVLSILKQQTETNSPILIRILNNLENIQIKDCSKGCDNFVYMVSNNNGNGNEKIIIRIPKQLDSEEEFPIMHQPIMQSKLLESLNSIGLNELDIQVPHTIALDSNNRYLIESYIPYQDLSEIYNNPSKEMTDELIINEIFSKVGSILYKIHSSNIISNSLTYGNLINTSLQGSLSNWNNFFEVDYIKQINSMPINIDIMNDNISLLRKWDNKDQVVKILHDLYNNSIKDYLINFNKPCLVHADLVSSNIRIDFEGHKVTGIIDFADSISGDGLYDIGRILNHVEGNWKFINSIEIGYTHSSSFTNQQSIIIIFYAISICVWLLDISTTDEDIKKHNIILSNLLSLYLK